MSEILSNISDISCRVLVQDGDHVGDFVNHLVAHRFLVAVQIVDIDLTKEVPRKLQVLASENGEPAQIGFLVLDDPHLPQRCCALARLERDHLGRFVVLHKLCFGAVTDVPCILRDLIDDALAHALNASDDQGRHAVCVERELFVQQIQVSVHQIKRAAVESYH